MLFATNSRVSQWLLVSATTLALGVSVGACKKDEKAGKEESASPGEMVTLTKEGAKIDPPAKKSQIPAGAWMCDMGTVHFARSEKGDGTCPLCEMPLVQKKGDKASAAAEPAPAAPEPAPAATIDGGAKAAGDHAGHAH